MIIEPILDFLQRLGVNVDAIPSFFIAVAVIAALVVGLVIVLRVLLRLADAVIRIGCTVFVVIVIGLILAELFL
jgi:uncharacterized membrane protein YraQ (UPF0718 family)